MGHLFKSSPFFSCTPLGSLVLSGPPPQYVGAINLAQTTNRSYMIQMESLFSSENLMGSSTEAFFIAYNGCVVEALDQIVPMKFLTVHQSQSAP